MPLTDTECRKTALPKKGVIKLFDGNGLFLQIDAKGRRYWRLQYYRPSDKKKDIIALGVYPNVTLKEARMLRNEAKVLIQKGIDPKQHNREEKKLEEQAAQNTFQQIAQQWFSGFQADTEKRSLEHTKRVYRSLEIHVFPFLGKRQIDTIMPMDVLEIARAVEREGKGDTAHRVLSAIKMVFGYAVRMRICLFNPASDLSQELKSIKQKHFPTITDPDDLGKLLVDIEGWTGAPQVRALLNLSPLVFTRPSEVRTMKWSEIDFDKALWEKPAETMKNGIAHTVPLSRQALAIIESMRPVTGHYEYVFHNNTTKKPLSEGASRKALIAMGYKDKFTPHGWRHAASTILNTQGYNSDWIEAQLAHKDSNTIRAAYNHANYLDDRIKMMQDWADYLDNLKAQALKTKEKGNRND